MSDIRFQSLEDGDLADIWYAVAGAAVRHPDHFQKLMDACFQELLARRESGLNPWIEERFRSFRLADSKEDAETNLRTSPEARPAAEPRSEGAGQFDKKEFLDLSTNLFNDMKAWIVEAAQDDTLSASDLALINTSVEIVERATLKKVNQKNS